MLEKHNQHFFVVKIDNSIEATNEETQETNIVSKRKVVSPVWDHFGQHVDSEGKVLDSDTAVCCRYCSNVRGSGGNTSNLLSHLRVHHPTQ